MRVGCDARFVRTIRSQLGSRLRGNDVKVGDC